MKILFIKPKNLSESDIKKGMEKIYQDFYSFKEIARRLKNSLKRDFNFSKFVIFFVRNILRKAYVLGSIKKTNFSKRLKN